MPSAMTNDTQQITPASKKQVPVMKRNILLKGYIKSSKEDQGPYEGVCLNLNLVVRGRTLEETEQKLFLLIVAYLSDAQKDGTWNDLVPRRAPASYYFQYYVLKIQSHFRSLAEFKLFVRSAPCMAHA